MNGGFVKANLCKSLYTTALQGFIWSWLLPQSLALFVLAFVTSSRVIQGKPGSCTAPVHFSLPLKLHSQSAAFKHTGVRYKLDQTSSLLKSQAVACWAQGKDEIVNVQHQAWLYVPALSWNVLSGQCTFQAVLEPAAESQLNTHILSSSTWNILCSQAHLVSQSSPQKPLAEPTSINVLDEVR